MCVFDDVVEHCGEGAQKYLPACFPAFMDGLTEVHTAQILHKLSDGLGRSTTMHPYALNSLTIATASPDASAQCRHIAVRIK